MHMGDVRNFAAMSAEELEIEPDGTFEILVSAEQQRGNWLPLHPDATQIVIRQYFYDWERMKSIEAWIQPGPGDTGRVAAYKRRNVCYANVA